MYVVGLRTPGSRNQVLCVQTPLFAGGGNNIYTRTYEMQGAQKIHKKKYEAVFSTKLLSSMVTHTGLPFVVERPLF